MSEEVIILGLTAEVVVTTKRLEVMETDDDFPMIASWQFLIASESLLRVPFGGWGGVGWGAGALLSNFFFTPLEHPAGKPASGIALQAQLRD